MVGWKPVGSFGIGKTMEHREFYLDTEFHEFENCGIDTIELISIGITDSHDRDFYQISNEFDIRAAWENEWLRYNVLEGVFNDLQERYVKDHPSNVSNTFLFNEKNLRLFIYTYGKTRSEIKTLLIDYIGNVTPVFWGYYCDYDWVVFCWLFGRMIDLPKRFPMFCLDLKQVMYQYALSKEWKREFCPDPENAHNALVDAKWNKDLHWQINTQVEVLDLKPMEKSKS